MQPLSARRRFLGGLASFVLLPRANAQADRYRIGYIDTTSRSPALHVDAFRARLRELGYREGVNMATELRFLDGDPERLPSMTREIVRARPHVVVVGGEGFALAVKAASPSLPVVLAWSLDPVQAGLAASLAHPGGNVTGLAWEEGTDQMTKRLQLYKEALPSLKTLACLWDPTLPGAASFWPKAYHGADRLRLELRPIDIRSSAEIPAALEAIRSQRPSALWVWGGPALNGQQQIIDFALSERLPLFASGTYWVDQGALLGYSVNTQALYMRAAEFVDKILKGAKPGDLPIEQPSRFELVVNLRTAKAIGLSIPRSLLGFADRIVE